MKKEVLIGLLLIFTLCSCQLEHYSFEDIDKYLKEKYPNINYVIDKNFVEEEYDQIGNTKRKYEVKNNETGKKCYAFSVKHYREHAYYQINDNCEEILK